MLVQLNTRVSDTTKERLEKESRATTYTEFGWGIRQRVCPGAMQLASRLDLLPTGVIPALRHLQSRYLPSSCPTR
jgi:hypothetical protein